MLPETIENEAALEEVLTRPSPALVEAVRALHSPLVLLGAGGKMGPSLAMLARRAAQAAGRDLEITAVSRFSDPATRLALEAHDIHTVSADLLDPHALDQLPAGGDVIYLVGLKFGTAQNPAATWAVNTLAPERACSRYRGCRIAALSSGSLYPLTPVSAGGADETHPLTPLGEYANACVARERIFEYCSHRDGTPLALLRLFYAVDMRYGVLVDLAQKVYQGKPVDLSMGHVNWIWQGDANELILRSLALASAPPQAYNLTGPVCSVRALALRLGELMDREVTFSGSEAPTALLGSPARLNAALGAPGTPPERVLGWVADWTRRGGRLLDKPTHFETRDGRY